MYQLYPLPKVSCLENSILIINPRGDRLAASQYSVPGPSERRCKATGRLWPGTGPSAQSSASGVSQAERLSLRVTREWLLYQNWDIVGIHGRYIYIYIWSRVPCSHPPPHGMGGGMMPLWWCIYIHTYLHTYLPTYLHTYIHTITITLHYLTLHYHTLHTYIHTYHYITITLHYLTLHYLTLPYITLPYLTFHTSIHTYIHTIPLPYMPLHYLTLHYLTLPYITLHTYILTSIHTYIHPSIHPSIHTYIPTYQHTNIPTYQHTTTTGHRGGGPEEPYHHHRP